MWSLVYSSFQKRDSIWDEYNNAKLFIALSKQTRFNTCVCRVLKIYFLTLYLKSYFTTYMNRHFLLVIHHVHVHISRLCTRFVLALYCLHLYLPFTLSNDQMANCSNLKKNNNCIPFKESWRVNRGYSHSKERYYK